MKLVCLMQHQRKYEAKIVMRVRVLKLKFVNSTIYDSSNNVLHCNVCRKAGPDISGKTEFVTGKKKFKRENLVY